MSRRQEITCNGYPKGRNCRKCKYNAHRFIENGRIVRYCSLTGAPERYPEMMQTCNKFVLDRLHWIDLKHRVVEIDG